MFWSVLSDEQRRRLLIIGGVGAILAMGAGGLLVASHTSGPADPEPALRDVQDAEKNKDAEKLRDAISDANERKAAAAVGGLARVGGAAYRPVIQGALRDSRVQVRQQAMTWYPSVANWRIPGDAKPLQDAIATEKSNDVLVAALKALGHMKAWDSLELLFQKMKDPDRSVRMAAALAAEEILFVRVFPKYGVDDPQDARLAAIKSFREFANEPGRRRRYMEWLEEERQKQAKQEQEQTK